MQYYIRMPGDKEIELSDAYLLGESKRRIYETYYTP